MGVQTETASSAQRPRLFTGAFLSLAIASLAYFTAAGMTLPALPRLVEGPLGGGDIAVGVVFGAFSVSAVLLRPAAGVIGDRRGRRPLLIAGAALAGASILAYGLATTSAVLVGLRLVTGAGEALFFVGMVTMFADLAPAERRGEAMSLASLGLYLGIGIGPPIAEAIERSMGLSAVWIVAAFVCVAATALALRVPETRPELAETPDGPAGARRGRLVHPAGILPGAVLFASIVGMAGFLAFVPLHVLDIGMASAGLVLLLFAGMVVLVRSLGARLPDLLGPTRAIRAALTLSAVALTLVATWHTVTGMVLGAVLLGFGVALITPSVFALAAAAAPEGERGQVMATTSAFIDVAFGLGPMVMGLVATGFGRPAVFATGALMAIAGLVLVTLSQLGGARTAAAGGPRSRRVAATPAVEPPAVGDQHATGSAVRE
jgi:MFS family permease